MNTYLYGIGPRTQRYIADHPNMIINGILDGYRQSGEFCGIRVLALEDISTDHAQIIIVARPASARIIYARIEAFCAEKNVEIYDVQGRKMEPQNAHSLSEDKLAKYKIAREKLYREIDNHQAVSFDIFDTLLVRKCGSAETLFAYVAVKRGLPYRFVEERVRAEKELSQVMTPTIENIYQRIAADMPLSHEESRQIISEEIEAEKKFLIVREELAEAFRYAIAKGKQVLLVSDMYFSCRVIQDILAEKGIEGYTDLIVSSECSTDKAGELYDIAARKTAGKSLLHIGDDEYRDCECAVRHGLDVFPIRTTTEDMGWNLASPETIGYSLLGPALFSFTLWLHDRLREDDIHRIYFLARDGYLIKQIFDMVECSRVMGGEKASIDSQYLLTSRSLTTAASLQGEDDIRKSMELSFDGRPDEMLRKRFYLNVDEIQSCDNDMNPGKYILKHKEAILKKSKRLRDNYLKYLEKAGLTRKGKAAIFDFVSTGTCQMCLECILGKDLSGYHYETAEDGDARKSALQIKSFIRDIGFQYSCDNYFGIETLIKETVPTLREIDDTGAAIYGKECMEPYQKEIIRTVQAQALEYARDRLALMPGQRFEPEEAGDNALRMRQITTKLLTGDKPFINYDAFSNREVNE